MKTLILESGSQRDPIAIEAQSQRMTIDYYYDEVFA